MYIGTKRWEYEGDIIFNTFRNADFQCIFHTFKIVKGKGHGSKGREVAGILNIQLGRVLLHKIKVWVVSNANMWGGMST